MRIMFWAPALGAAALLSQPAMAGEVEPDIAAALSLPSDVNFDGVVDSQDLGRVLGRWGLTGERVEDINHDGVVDGGDMGMVLGAWSDERVISFIHISGDMRRRTVPISRVRDIATSPWSAEWTRIWIINFETGQIDGLDAAAPYASVEMTLFNRFWAGPATFR